MVPKSSPMGTLIVNAQPRVYIKYGLILLLIILGLLNFTKIISFHKCFDPLAIESADGSKQKQILGDFCKEDQLTLDHVLLANDHKLPESDFNETKLERICLEEDAVNCAVPHRRVNRDNQWIYVLEKAKSVVCTIPKNLSQLLSGLVCLLHDELSFFYEKADIFSQNYLTKSCVEQYRPWMDNAINDFNATADFGWSYLAITREPIERFISAYMYVCVQGVNMNGGEKCGRFCYNCGANLTCFVENHYREMMRLSNYEREGVSFLEHHTYPQSWRCDIHRFKENFQLIEFDSNSTAMINRMIEYFEPRNVSERALTYARELATSQRTHHSALDSPIKHFYEKRLRSSPYLMELLYRTYHHDYRVLGFDRKSVLREFSNKN